MHDRALVVSLAVIVALLLLAPTVAGIAIGKAFNSTPLGLALGAGAGVLLATAAVTRIMRSRFAQMAQPDWREESSE